MRTIGQISPMKLFKARYLARYKEPLARCEERIKDVAGAPGGYLSQSCVITLEAGGKRLRPLLVLLSSGKKDHLTDGHYAAAAAVELVHMATLVHDDVLDRAELRRGVPTVVSRYGPSVSTSAGDYLFSSAFEVLSETGNTRAISMLAKTSLDLSLGELMQMEQARNYSLSAEAYRQRCLLKTAGLFSTSCSLGALLSGHSDEVISAMSEYGSCLGLAFQIADDILDFTGDAGRFGKRVGTDLRDGTVTLPLIFALEEDTSLAAMLEAEPDGNLIDEICLRVKKTGAIEAAASEARRCVDLARQALESAPPEIETDPLVLIAKMAADRKV